LLKAVDVRTVRRKFDPSKLGFPMNLLLAMKWVVETDFRDRDAIRAWANELSKKL